MKYINFLIIVLIINGKWKMENGFSNEELEMRN